MSNVYCDICQEKIISGKNIPCFEKKDAACMNNGDDCLSCKYFIDAANQAKKKNNKK